MSAILQQERTRVAKVKQNMLEGDRLAVCSHCQSVHDAQLINGRYVMHLHNVPTTNIPCEGGGTDPEAIL